MDGSDSLCRGHSAGGVIVVAARTTRSLERPTYQRNLSLVQNLKILCATPRLRSRTHRDLRATLCAESLADASPKHACLFAPDSGEGVLVLNSFGCASAHKTAARKFAMPALAVVLMASGMSLEASLARADDKPPAPTKGQVNDAKTKLQQLSEQVGQTKAAVEAAENKLPGAEGDVKDAEAAAEKASAAVAVAQADVDKANQAVAAQQEQVQQVKTQINQLLVQVSKLARNAYIDGGQYQSLELILGASSPSDLANQRVAVTHTSHENSQAYNQLVAAKAALAQKLAELKQLQDQAQQRQQDAQDKADAAQAAAASAQNAKQSVVALINQRNSALAEVQTQLKEIRKTYEQLLAQYENAHQGSTRVPNAKNQPARSGQAVIDWALQWVGKGSMYDGLCLGFVDDAYGASSGRVGRAIDQWYRAKAAGYGHPGDRNPPVGAQVFWWTGNAARHIALYAGGGMVITTGGDGDRVAIVSMSYLDSWGPYIGWAPGYYG